MTTLVMGVLNVTPDSFSDGGLFLDPSKAVAHGIDLIDSGADMIDVGGESTRPGAAFVSIDEEIARVIPVVEALSDRIRVSIDTRRAEVARAAVGAGATIINDVSASLYEVAATEGAGWIAMHMQGEPQTMQARPEYANVVREVSEFLIERANTARRAGVDEVWIDPGIGFGKTVEHNVELIAQLDVLTQSDFPVVVGTSRKSFLGKLPGAGQTLASPGDRLEGSLATAIWAACHGAAIIRVHDVLETVRALHVVNLLKESQEIA